MKCLKFILFALFCLSVVGCATTKKNADTTSASTEWRIKSLEESFLNFREKQRQMADENAQNLEKFDHRLATVETELANLKTGGGMETPAAEAPPMKEGWVTDLKPEDDGWVEGQKPAEKTMVENDEEKPWANVPKPPAVIPEPEVIQRPVPQKTTAPKPVKAASSTALYDKGYAQYNAGDFEASRATFDSFLAKYPHDALAPNALYWKGETYYSQNKYTQAILTFKEVTGQFPKDRKAASALLKIGMSYDRVGDRDNAVFYMRALLQDFPNSDAAGLARKELARLGG